LKYTVSYSEKESVQMPSGNYKSVEIGLHKEFDDAVTPFEAGCELVRNLVKEKLKAAVSEFTEAAASVSEKPEEKQIRFVEEPKPAPTPAPKPKPVVTMEQVSASFPQELAGLLYFESADEYVLVKAHQYLGPENFRKVAAIVRDKLGGEYISAGKDSHFRIKKSEATASKPEAPPNEEPTEEEIFARDEPVEEIPEFDPEVLMQWSWKAKKKDDGTYGKGSTSYGWDFANNFPESVIRVLEKEPQTVDQYVFSLDDSRKFVQARKKKEST
jgi:hypothetical protein